MQKLLLMQRKPLMISQQWLDYTATSIETVMIDAFRHDLNNEALDELKSSLAYNKYEVKRVGKHASKRALPLWLPLQMMQRVGIIVVLREQVRWTIPAQYGEWKGQVDNNTYPFERALVREDANFVYIDCNGRWDKQ